MSQCAAFAMTSFDFQCDANSNVCFISHRLRDIPYTYLKNEGQGQGAEEWDLRHSTGRFAIDTDNFLSKF